MEIPKDKQYHKSQRQHLKFHTFRMKTYISQLMPRQQRQKQEDTTAKDSQNEWVKNFSDRNLTEPEKKVLAKGFIFAISPQQQLITTTETVIRINKLTQPEVEPITLKVSDTFS